MENLDYILFDDLIKVYKLSGFQHIDASLPIVRNLEKMTEMNDQFFFIGDLMKVKVLFSSKRCWEMLGIKPKEVDPASFFIRSHPDNLPRHNLVRTKLFNLAQQFFVEKKGDMIMSSTFKIKSASGDYKNTLIQCRFFYSEIPYETVFVIYVATDVSWADEEMKGYHYYLGNDFSNFRIPDLKLLKIGCSLSDREFEILEMISRGMSSEDIAAKIFLSVHTVNTHRRNIIAKTGKNSTYDLITEYRNMGFL